MAKFHTAYADVMRMKICHIILMAGGRVGKKMENGVDLNAVIKEKAWQGQAAHNLDHEPEIMYAQVIYETPIDPSELALKPLS